MEDVRRNIGDALQGSDLHIRDALKLNYKLYSKASLKALANARRIMFRQLGFNYAGVSK